MTSLCRPELSAGFSRCAHIHVVVLDIEASDSVQMGLAHTLDETTLARVRRYRQPRDRQRSLIGYAALHHHLRTRSASLACPAALHWSELGRPLVQSPAPCWVSLSHGGDYAAIAIADHPVGIDLEPWESAEILQPATLAHLCFSSAEAAWAGDDPHRCLQIWTAKEAVLKALGLGASGPWRDFIVPPPSQEFQAVTTTHEAHPLISLRVAHCSAISGVQLALCLQYDGPVHWRLHRQSAAELLAAAAITTNRKPPLTCHFSSPIYA